MKASYIFISKHSYKTITHTKLLKELNKKLKKYNFEFKIINLVSSSGGNPYIQISGTPESIYSYFIKNNYTISDIQELHIIKE